MITEKVKVVYLEGGGKCTVETSDGFNIPGIPCNNAKVGDNITATYDVKVKDRESKI